MQGELELTIENPERVDDGVGQNKDPTKHSEHRRREQTEEVYAQVEAELKRIQARLT